MGHSGTPPLLLPIVRTHSAQYCCPSPSACFLPPPPKHFPPITHKMVSRLPFSSLWQHKLSQETSTH